MQFAKEKACDIDDDDEMKNKKEEMNSIIVQRVKEEDDFISCNDDDEEAAVVQALRRALGFYSTFQCDDGFWPGDYGGPLFLLPGLV